MFPDPMSRARALAQHQRALRSSRRRSSRRRAPRWLAVALATLAGIVATSVLGALPASASTQQAWIGLASKLEPLPVDGTYPDGGFPSTVVVGQPVTSFVSLVGCGACTGNDWYTIAGYNQVHFYDSAGSFNSVTTTDQSNNDQGTVSVTFTHVGPDSVTFDGTNGGSFEPAVGSVSVVVVQPPAITSAAAVTFAAGAASRFTVSTSGYPTPSITEVGALPPGVTLTDNGNGTASLAGTPDQASAGSWPIMVTAVNGYGTAATQRLVLTVSPPIAYTGQLATLAGTGAAGNLGNGGAALSAELDRPWATATDATGDVYFTDSTNNLVQMVPHADGTYFGQTMTAGHIYTVAGTGGGGYAGDASSATAAELLDPQGLAVGPHGDLVIADSANDRIRFVPAASGTYFGQSMTAGDIYTVAGDGTAGYYGDTGPAATAKLNDPVGVAVDGSGNIVIADTGNNVVRMVPTISGTYFGEAMTAGDIYTVAGDGTAGYRNGPAASAELDAPASVAVDPDGDLLIGDSANSAIRELAARSGNSFGHLVTEGDVDTIAGGSAFGDVGNGGPASAAQIEEAYGLATDASGDLFLSDYSGAPGSGDVREIAATSHPSFGISMTAGDIYQVADDLGGPTGIAASPSGALYVADYLANEIRVLGTAPSITSADSTSFAAGVGGSFTVTAGGSPTPTFSSAGALPPGVRLAANGTLSGMPALGTAGTYPLTVYASNGVGSPASQNVTLTVSPAPTSVAVSASPAGLSVASTATIKATVSPTPDSGTVAFRDAAGYITGCAAVAVSSGVATCATSTITSTAPDDVVASYAGDAQFASSSGRLTITASPATTSLVLTSSPAVPTALATATLTATVTPRPDGGSVAFSSADGNVAGCGAEPVDPLTGAATCTTRALAAPGVHSIQATYSGSADYRASTASLPMTIDRAMTSVVMTTSPSPVVAGSPMKVTATVTGPDGPVNGGTVAFGDTGGAVIAADGCGAVPVSNGAASCDVASVPSASADTLTASYSGSALYSAQAVTSTVSPDKRPTALVLSASTGALVVGQPTTLTASLDQTTSATLAFSDSSGLISGCAAVPMSSGPGDTMVASCTTGSPDATGDDTVTVSYAGDAIDNPTSLSETLAIDSEPTLNSTTTLAATVGQAFSSIVSTSASPPVVAIAENGGSLPPGLALTDDGNGTATISGTPTAGGLYRVDVALADGVIAPVVRQLTIAVGQVPAFTTTSTGTCVAGSACDISVATVGYPVAQLGVTAALPSGLSFRDNGDGTGSIVGDATGDDVGTVTFGVFAHNGIGSGVEQHFSLTVSANPPATTTVVQAPPPAAPASGPSGNSLSRAAPARPQVVSYSYRATLTGAMHRTVICTATSSAVTERGSAAGGLKSLGLSLVCKSGKNTVTIRGAIASGTRLVKKKTAAGSIVRRHVATWRGGFRMVEPVKRRRMVLVLRPLKVELTHDRVVLRAMKVKGSGGRHRDTYCISWSLVPHYGA